MLEIKLTTDTHKQESRGYADQITPLDLATAYDTMIEAEEVKLVVEGTIEFDPNSKRKAERNGF